MGIAEAGVLYNTTPLRFLSLTTLSKVHFFSDCSFYMEYSLSEQHETYHYAASFLSGNWTTLFDRNTYFLFLLNSSLPVPLTLYNFYDSVFAVSGTWAGLIFPPLPAHVALPLWRQSTVQKFQTCLYTFAIILHVFEVQRTKAKMIEVASLTQAQSINTWTKQVMVTRLSQVQIARQVHGNGASARSHRHEYASQPPTILNLPLSPNSQTPRKGEVLRAVTLTRPMENFHVRTWKIRLQNVSSMFDFDKWKGKRDITSLLFCWWAKSLSNTITVTCRVTVLKNHCW